MTRQVSHLHSRLTLILAQTFAAMRYPNYRIWFAGLLISSIGGWMQSTAQQYLVYELTGSSAYLGIIGFANGIPSWMFMLLGGLLADKFSRKKILIITQLCLMTLALIAAALIFTGVIQPWHILILAFLLGVVNAFDTPARSAFLIELVDREDLTNAIALNSMVFNLAIIIGPAISGIIYAVVGPGWCFAINGVSFLAVFATLFIMRLAPFERQPRTRSALSEVKEGIAYIFSHNTVRKLIGNLGFIGIFSFSIMTLLPAWATNFLAGDSRTYGLLLSGRGVGAVAGALMIATLSNRNVRGIIWTAGSIAMPLVMLIFPQVRSLPLSILVMAGFGWCVMALVNTSTAMVQMVIPDNLRGRVMSIYNMVFNGSLPVGSLMNGTLAAAFGEPMTIMANGVMMSIFAISTLIFWPGMRKLE
jgi:MFS family permease